MKTTIFSVALFLLIQIALMSCGPKSNVNKAKKFINSKKYSDAIALLKNDVDAGLSTAKTHLLLGNAYVCSQYNSQLDSLKTKNIDDFNNAIIEYNKAIELDSSFVSAFYNLAVLLGTTGQKSQAIDLLQKVIELDSTHRGAYTFSSLFFADLKNFNQAEVFYKKAYFDDPLGTKWYKLKSRISTIIGQPGTIIIKKNKTPVFSGNEIKYYLNKFDIREYSSKGSDKYFLPYLTTGWVPNNPSWFRGVFEASDNSIEGNIYDSPGRNRKRYDKSRIKSGSVKKLGRTAIDQGAFGVARQGWYKVEFALNSASWLSADSVSEGSSNLELDKKRVDILSNSEYWGNETINNLTDFLITKGMDLRMLIASRGELIRSSFLPSETYVKEIYQNDNIIFEFKNGKLSKWNELYIIY